MSSKSGSWGPFAAATSFLSTLAITRFSVPPFAPSPDDPAVADPKNALLLFDLSERVLVYESTNDDPKGENPTIDDAASVAYELIDADGKEVGRTKGVGRMLFQRPDGGFVAWFSEVITLGDGTVLRTGGQVDDTRLTAGEHAIVPAVAVAGPFKGAIGYHQFRPVVPHKEYASAIALYRY